VSSAYRGTWDTWDRGCALRCSRGDGAGSIVAAEREAGQEAEAVVGQS